MTEKEKQKLLIQCINLRSHNDALKRKIEELHEVLKENSNTIAKIVERVL